jgi:mannose-6-phosphate isomerase-like protein (cupin superfamily)
MFRFTPASLALIGFAVAQQAPVPKLEGVTHWPAGKLKDLSPALNSRIPVIQGERKSMSAFEQLGTYGKYSFLEGRRNATASPEIHEGIDDIFVVHEGEATVLYGGKVEGWPPAKRAAMHGARLVGASSVKIRPGDVLAVPGNIPHQMVLEEGKSIVFLCIKVETVPQPPGTRH